jgi:hypothetical protein
MISGIKIERYRGICECKIDGFKDINILVGRNNQGKSSILEALYLASAAFRVDDPFRRDANKMSYLLNRRSRRGLVWTTSKQTLWYRYDSTFPLRTEITFKGRSSSESEKSNSVGSTLRFELPDWFEIPLIGLPLARQFRNEFMRFFERIPPPSSADIDLSQWWISLRDSSIYKRDGGFPINRDELQRALRVAYPDFWNINHSLRNMMFLDADLMHNMQNVEKALWNDLLKDRLDKLVANVLRKGYNMSVEDLTYMPIADIYQLAAKLPKTTIRVDDLGDGARYSMIWIMVAALAKGTIILIEEPESHQHPGGLVKSLEIMLDLAKKQNIQLFVTTHSLEFIKIVEKITEEKRIDLATFFIEMNKRGQIDYRKITSQDSDYLAKMGLDIRFLDII